MGRTPDRNVDGAVHRHPATGLVEIVGRIRRSRAGLQSEDRHSERIGLAGIVTERNPVCEPVRGGRRCGWCSVPVRRRLPTRPGCGSARRRRRALRDGRTLGGRDERDRGEEHQDRAQYHPGPPLPIDGHGRGRAVRGKGRPLPNVPADPNVAWGVRPKRVAALLDQIASASPLRPHLPVRLGASHATTARLTPRLINSVLLHPA